MPNELEKVMKEKLSILRTGRATWHCKYCGENGRPKCHKCVREDGKLVTDELSREAEE